ncbi:MAG: aminoglycoside phosphotransferase family protein [Chloroflexi bacterium]|nr:aminoglycoside phosphotransferase family protein [Chloroflexota bacterium]
MTLTRNGQCHYPRGSVIVKTIDPHGAVASYESVRELCFYQVIHPELRIAKPHIHLATTDESSGFHVIVMEDLTTAQRIPSHPHQWTRAELSSVLRACAQLHASRIENLDHAWLAPRHESLLDLEKIPEQVAVVQRAGIWGDLPELSHLIAYARASCQKYANEKVSLLHGDTTPANAALPNDLESQPATLIDWQDVGIGMPEIDLAYMDLQPFGSARLIPRTELLDLYWHFRTEIDSNIPSSSERRTRQLHADVVNTLWLTTPASRVALHPFPTGSYPQTHWASQFGIVYKRLKDLIQEIQR